MNLKNREKKISWKNWLIKKLLTNEASKADILNFIAKDQIDYIEKAKIIFSDISKLNQIRKSLRNLAMNSPLFDNEDFGLELSKTLKDKWTLFSQQNKNL